ncbi:helix-hairpin-helix domain-containing protein [Kordia sp. YSTF-M3]|uniref:Helix-hairpin-helix domain-containing protein n=1 Tax=Kordia aestuariivivens TaxID=2759037 RepID=A0ABR7QFU6_9FLAO|nr:helix-hairpin-helix domain-containing protein [Kordia aestuariivivens]MBC8757435.1 helix-hairpin-helix domain-containing protein [Kordia aestuariivivens]
MNRSKVIGQKIWYILQINNLIKFNFALLSFAIVFYSITLSFYGSDIIKNNNEYNIINPFKVIKYAENEIDVLSSTMKLDTRQRDLKNQLINLNFFLVYDATRNHSFDKRKTEKLLYKFPDSIIKNTKIRYNEDFIKFEILHYLSSMYKSEKSKISSVSISFSSSSANYYTHKYIQEITDFKIDSLYYYFKFNIPYTKTNFNRKEENKLEKIIIEVFRKNEKVKNMKNTSTFFLLANSGIINSLDFDFLNKEINISELEIIQLYNEQKSSRYFQNISPNVKSKIRNLKIPFNFLHNDDPLGDYISRKIWNKNIINLYYDSETNSYKVPLTFKDTKQKKYIIKVFSEIETDLSKLEVISTSMKNSKKFVYDEINNNHLCYLYLKNDSIEFKINDEYKKLKFSIKSEDGIEEYLYDLSFNKQLPSNPAFTLLALGYIISGLSIFLILLFITWITLHFKYKNTIYQTSNSTIINKEIENDHNPHIELTSITHIGQKRAELLQNHYIKTLEDFVNTTEEKLSEILNSGKGIKLSKKQIMKMKEIASKIMNQ